jgi:cytochrome c553
MISTRLSTALGALILAAALTAPANTANTAEAAANVGTTNEFIAKMGMCNQCHGQAGNPVRPGIPVIWGQDEAYILKQLKDFRTKARDAELMTWASLTLHDDAEMAAAMSFFGKKTWPAPRAAAAKGAATPRPNGMAVCEACHQLNFAGGPTGPRLAGQNFEYLVESMRKFADGERKNNPEMAQMMSTLMPAQREAMARYLSGL